MRLGTGAGLVCALLLAPPARAESYRDLVAAYQRGDRGAIERVAARSGSDLRRELKWLQEMRSCGQCGERELADRFPFLAAALLHTERAFLDYEARREPAMALHLDFARALLEAAPPRVRVFEPRWFAAPSAFSFLASRDGASAALFLGGSIPLSG